MVNKNSDEEVKRKNIGLQSFLESSNTYFNKLFNLALPVIENKEYYILIDRVDDRMGKRDITKDLKSTS